MRNSHSSHLLYWTLLNGYEALSLNVPSPWPWKMFPSPVNTFEDPVAVEVGHDVVGRLYTSPEYWFVRDIRINRGIRRDLERVRK